MDIKSYIESGKLEAYAMNFCSQEEAAEVEMMCSQYPELQTELDSIRRAMEAYTDIHAKAPSPKVKANLLETLDFKEQPQMATKPAPDMVKLYTRVRRFAVAAIALFVMSFAFNLILFNRWKETNNQLTALNAEKTRLSEAYTSTQVKMTNMHTEMDVMADPNTVKVMMKGMEQSPKSLAMVYWNKSTKKVMLKIETLPMPEAGKQYQLWAIVDGQPKDAGMIELKEGDDSLHPMKDFPTAQAFAITLEKAGGSPAPTMSAMYVMGAVSL